MNDLIQILINSSKKNEDLNVPVNNFMVNEFSVSLETFINKDFDILQNIFRDKKLSSADMKTLIKILETLLKNELDITRQKLIAEKIIKSISFLDTNTRIYSVENNCRVNELLQFLKQ